MHDFLAMLRRSSGVATLIAVTTLVIAALSGAVVISSLIGRVGKLESDLGRAQARITELAASQSRLNASIDAAARSIKSLRSDLDRPRVQPLASILDAPR
jgi:predicted PurR-regulated permease PerM